MAFINPKIDFAFKKIFDSEVSTSILRSFLNVVWEVETLTEFEWRLADVEAQHKR